MSSLRIGFDLDGVLADFARAYRDMELRLYGPAEPARVENPEEIADGDRSETPPVPGRQRREGIWAAIRETPDFWQTLAPTDPAAVSRINDLSARHRWEVFFITQRPATEGATVQRQTQRWLVAQGFELPSVLVINGRRGAAAGALRLDYHVDDSSANCSDVKSESSANPILILGEDDAGALAGARRAGIATAPDIAAALDLLDRASGAHANPGILRQLAERVGWK